MLWLILWLCLDLVGHHLFSDASSVYLKHDVLKTLYMYEQVEKNKYAHSHAKHSSHKGQGVYPIRLNFTAQYGCVYFLHFRHDNH